MGQHFSYIKQEENRYLFYYFIGEQLDNVKKEGIFPKIHGGRKESFKIKVDNTLEEIEKSLSHKDKKEFENFIKKEKQKIKSLTSDEYKPFLEKIFDDLEENKEDTFVYYFRKLYKSEPSLLKDLGNNLEYLDRLTDIAATNKEQKLASILWFGERGKPEHRVVLEELENENDAEVKSAAQKARLRLNERINSSKSKKTKMKVRMGGRVKPLLIDEDDIIVDDKDVYVSPVKSSVKVKMKVRMNGRIKSLPIDEEEILDLYE